MADIIELMLATGAHIGEVLALRWRDVDLDSGTVDINATIKTESGSGTYNVERRWRQSREEAGLEWITPEVFRRNALKRFTGHRERR